MEKIYTIPIHDAYDKQCGCPLCRLSADLEKASLEYVMGAAMMEPDVRMETNRYGFCQKHFTFMLTMQKRLPLALILESYTQELLSCMTQKSPGKKEFAALARQLTCASDGCFVCKQLEERLFKYASNIIYLWLHEDGFRDLTRAQEFFCPHHLSLLLTLAEKELPHKHYAAFYQDHMASSAKKLSVLSANVSKFCKSFDHRFANDPLGDAKTAVEDAIAFLSATPSEK